MFRYPLQKAAIQLALVVIAILGLLAPRTAQAADYSWTGAVSQNWFEAGNWTPSGVPGAADTASVTINSTATVGDKTVTVKALNIDNNGTVVGTTTESGTGTINITGTTSVWGGGYIGLTVNNSGTVTWGNTAGFGNLDKAVFNNNGTFNATSNASWFPYAGTGHAFNNKGTVVKTGAGTTSTFSIPFNNNGVVNTQSGTLALSTGTSSGTFAATAGAFTDFSPGTHVLTGGAKFTGTGRSRIVNQGVVSVNGSIVGGSGGTLELVGGVITTPPSGGRLTGSLLITSGYFSNCVFDNDGTVTWSGTAGVGAADKAIFNNNGTFNATSTASWFPFSGTGFAFNNKGTLVKSVAGSTTSFSIPFNNTGTVNALSGTLALSTGTSSGTFTASNGAFTDFNSGTHVLTGGAKFTGAGRGRIVNQGTVQVEGDIVGGAGGTLELVGGVITTAANGGTLTGTLLVTSGYFSNCVFENNGTVTWSGTAGIGAADKSVFNNNGTFVATSTASWFPFSGSGYVFNNKGTLVKSGTGTTTSFAIPFNNTGTVNAQGGALALSTGTSTGTFAASAGAFTDFNSGTHTLTGGAKFTGAGRGRIANQGTVNINGSIVGGTAGGTLELNGGVITTPAGGGTTTGTLLLTTGYFSNCNFNNNGTATWNGSNGIGMFDKGVFNNNGVFNADSPSSWFPHSGTGHAFNNKGILNLADPGRADFSIPFTQTSTGTLNLGIGGTTPGTGFDQLALGNVVTLGGKLQVSLLSPFTPVSGAVFPVVTHASGAPGSTTFASFVGNGFSIQYTPTAVNVVANNTNYPVISSFTPALGKAGTSVTISGSSFTGASLVTFNGTSAGSAGSGFVVNATGTSITTTVPAGATTGPISVRTARGTATSATNFTVTYPAPVITGFTPDSGGIGTMVIISGDNFQGATQVLINQTAASFTVNPAGTSVTATVPLGATSGLIRVTGPGGTAVSGSAFTVIPAPVIGDFTPMVGGTGTTATITGANFGGATVVKFGNTAASFTVNAGGTAITATVPAGAVTGPITVTTPGGTDVSATNFTVAPIPEIVSFTPGSGPVGTVVTITGSRFTGATLVEFNGAGASFLRTGDTSITATVPPGATTGPISITNTAGESVSTDDFIVTATGATALLGFSPSGGLTGSNVTISGVNLAGASAVKFNGAPANFTVVSPTTITATVPIAKTGPITVTTATGTVGSSAPFTVGPRVTALSPTSGSVGAFVIITGINFESTTSVRFNGTGAAYSVASATQIVAVVPAGATTGPISITALGGTSNSPTFTVTGAAALTGRNYATGTPLSAATAFVSRQTIELVFARPLAAGGVGSTVQYGITVNGAPVGVEGVAQPDAARVELTLAEGSFKAGDAVRVSWSNLHGVDGELVTGAAGAGIVR